MTIPDPCECWECQEALVHAEQPTYKIIRFRFKGENETIATGLTLDEAQAHCNDESTHGGSTEDGTAWFDGYEAE